jgi:hypothetical protein
LIGSSCLAEEREGFAAFSEPQSFCQIVIIAVRIKIRKSAKSGDVKKDKETRLL